MSEMQEFNNLGLVQPRPVLSVVENQKKWQWVNNNDFYKLIPAPYYSFYNNWVRLWLYWYDGYVPWVHGSSNGLLSTSIGTTIVNRSADSVLGGNIMFRNARKPLVLTETNGKPIGKALDFISNDWSKAVDLKAKLKIAIRNAFAGGFSLLKLNKSEDGLWVDTLRADRFYISKTGRGEIRKVVSILGFYENITPDNKVGKKYALVEERRYEEIDFLTGKEAPIVEYKMYDSSVPIQYFTTVRDNFVAYEQLPKDVRKAFKEEYSCTLNKPQALNGFKNLGVYILNGSDEISNVPQIGLGESLLANILNYLYEFDFYNTCFNTDMYLARGRVMVPKYMQGASARGAQGSENVGLDSFLYDKFESPNPDANKPEAIQFELRSSAWKEARNILLESIATNIGISVSTLASYLNDGSNRTAREVSAEESATTLFIENNRRRFEVPINEMIQDVLRYYGYIDDVEIRWSRAGMTNQSVLVDTLSKAVASGLISQKKAHDQYNYDDDEEQNAEDYTLVEKEQANKQNSIFGGGEF
jgi:hypothetical protein